MVLKVAGAAEHILAVQAVAEVWDIGAVQFPSTPIYLEQVVFVPEYKEHYCKTGVHPNPVVRHPN